MPFRLRSGSTRFERHREYNSWVTNSISSLQRHGQIDQRLDPVIAAAALGSMTYRFPEMWFVQGMIDVEFDDVVDQLTLLFVRALGLPEPPEEDSPRLAATNEAAGLQSG